MFLDSVSRQYLQQTALFRCCWSKTQAVFEEQFLLDLDAIDPEWLEPRGRTDCERRRPPRQPGCPIRPSPSTRARSTALAV